METPLPQAPAQQEKRTGAVIAAIAVIVLCGLTGLCLICPGIALAANLWDTYDDIPNWTGYLLLCLSLLGIVIGTVVPILLLRKKKPAETQASPQDPIPPAS